MVIYPMAVYARCLLRLGYPTADLPRICMIYKTVSTYNFIQLKLIVILQSTVPHSVLIFETSVYAWE